MLLASVHLQVYRFGVQHWVYRRFHDFNGKTTRLCEADDKMVFTSYLGMLYAIRSENNSKYSKNYSARILQRVNKMVKNSCVSMAQVMETYSF